MKTYVRYTILCFFTLSPLISRAETGTITHYFGGMFNASPKTIEVTNTNHTATSTEDGIVYTCSSGAEFFMGPKSAGELALYLESSDAQVVISQIQNLDSISITFTPTWERRDEEMFYVAISENGVSGWTNLSTNYYNNTIRTVKLPRAGDYFVRIKRKSTDVYIRKINYIYIDLSGCPNCFLYKP